MKRKFVICLNILLMLIISSITLYSYAYFSPVLNTNNQVNINMNLSNWMYNFTSTNTSINLNTSILSSASVSNTIPAITSNTNLVVSLKSPDNNYKVSCTYDLIWEWNSTEQYITSDVTLPYTNGTSVYKYEMSTIANSTTPILPVGLSYNNDNKSNETDLSNNTWYLPNSYFVQYEGKNNQTTIVTNAMIASQSNSNPTVTTWNIKTNIYKLPITQTKLQNKNLKAKVYVSNVNCTTYLKPRFISGNINTSGSEVQIGSEYFYLLGEDETNPSNVKLLTKYNLFVGWNRYTGYILTDTVGYNMQSELARGYNSFGYYLAALEFSSSAYWIDTSTNTLKPQYGSSYSEYPYVYDSNSILYEYVEKYKTLVKQKFGINVDARLMTYNEANAIETTDWAHLTTFWTGSVEDGQFLHYIRTGTTYLSRYRYTVWNEVGLRPVIIVPKSIFN